MKDEKSDTLEELSALKLTSKALQERRQKLVRELNNLNEKLNNLQGDDRKRNEVRLLQKITTSTQSIDKLDTQLKSIGERIAVIEDSIEERGPRFHEDSGSVWDALIERTLDEYKDHQNMLNRFVGAANGALIALTLSFFNFNYMNIGNDETKMLQSLLLIAFIGLLASPLHSIVGMLQTARIHSMAISGYAEVHWARMVSSIANSSARYRRIRTSMLVLQYLLWFTAIVIGAISLSSILDGVTTQVEATLT